MELHAQCSMIMTLKNASQNSPQLWKVKITSKWHDIALRMTGHWTTSETWFVTSLDIPMDIQMDMQFDVKISVIALGWIWGFSFWVSEGIWHRMNQWKWTSETQLIGAMDVRCPRNTRLTPFCHTGNELLTLKNSFKLHFKPSENPAKTQWKPWHSLRHCMTAPIDDLPALK